MTDAKKEVKFDITVNEKWCKSCSICISFCPTDVFTKDEYGGPIIAAPEKCINCQLCVIRCPDFCIEVVPKPKEAVAA